MGKSEEDSGGRKLVYVSLGLTFVIGLVLGGIIFFLEFKSSRETAALQSKVSLLTNEIIVLRHNLAHLNNTVIGLNTKESSREAQPTEDEYEYAEEYDDPNSDSYEDEEDDENYNDNTPAPPSNSSPSSLMSKSSTNDGRSKRESYLDSDNILTKETISNINYKSGLEVDQNTSQLRRDELKEDNTQKTTYIMQKHFPGLKGQSPVKHKLNIRRTHHREISSQDNRLLRLLSKSKKKIELQDFDTELSSGVNTVNRYKRGGRQEDVEIFTRSEFSNNAGNTGNPAIAAHFGADESKCKYRRHQHCESNDIRFHPQNHIKDWQSANWMNLLGATSSLEINDGVLTAQHSGLYFIYAQVFYADTHDVCGFRIYQNNDPILQCTKTTIHQNNTRLHKRNSCFTGSLIHLQKGDRLMIKETEENRYTIFERTKTFFGLFKVGNL